MAPHAHVAEYYIVCEYYQRWLVRALDIAADVDLVQRTRRAVDDRELEAWEDELRDDAKDLIADVEAFGPFPSSQWMIEFLYGFVGQPSGV